MQPFIVIDSLTIYWQGPEEAPLGVAGGEGGGVPGPRGRPREGGAGVRQNRVDK